jgi:Tol biopolymer transport system component
LRRSGPSQYAVSDSGTLIYIPGTYFEIAPNLTLVWVDRKGEETPLSAEPDAYSNFRISPDGTRVALTVGGSTDADVWIWDFIRRTRTRLTFDKGEDGFPVWSPDSKRIAFHTHQNNTLGSVYWKAANGTGKEEAIGSFPGHEIFPWCWSSDGKTLLVRAGYRGISMDIGALSMEDDREYEPLLKEMFAEVDGIRLR